MGIPLSTTFREFIDVDVDLCAELTDDKIMQLVLVQPKSQSDSDDDSTDRPQSTTEHIMIALTLSSHVYDEGMTLTLQM